MHCVLHYGKGAEVLELRELCWMIYDDLKLTKKNIHATRFHLTSINDLDCRAHIPQYCFPLFPELPLVYVLITGKLTRAKMRIIFARVKPPVRPHFTSPLWW